MKLVSFFLCVALILSTPFFVYAEVKKSKTGVSSAHSALKKNAAKAKESQRQADQKSINSGIEERESSLIKHRVKSGETLAKIARMYGVTVEEIKKVNGLGKQRLIPGKTILIPYAQEEDEEEIVDVSQISYGKWKDQNERLTLVKVAKSFMGAPYKLGGSTVRGLDCSAFVKKIFEIFDVNLPRTAKEQYKVGRKIDKEELSVGDLVFFKTRPGRNYPTHVGIYIGNGNFIHASSHHKRGVRIDSLDTPFYQRTYVGAVRVKDLPDDVAETKDQVSSDRNS